MRRVFRPAGEKVAVSLDGVTGEMLRQGATGRECRGMARAVELFLEWCGGMGVASDRERGIAWLRERRQGMAVEAYEEMKAGLTTWFHLTGQAKTKVEVGSAGEALPGSGAGESGGSEPEISQGGRVNGVAGTWQEAGARFKGFLACKNYSRNTVECYVGWARRFCRWCLKSGKELAVVEVGDIRGFLEWLAGTQVVAKTQNQALNGLVAFFRHGMGKEPGEIGEYLRAKVSRRLPVVLDRKEAAAVMSDLEGRNRPMWLMAALAVKNPGAARSWGWQYVFGGQNLIVESATGRTIRWHVHENTVGRLLGEAARRCGVVRPVTCHALRHTFATLALENGTDIRTLQELLGHNDVSTTMIYCRQTWMGRMAGCLPAVGSHVMNRPGVVARSPLDGLAA